MHFLFEKLFVCSCTPHQSILATNGLTPTYGNKYNKVDEIYKIIIKIIKKSKNDQKHSSEMAISLAVSLIKKEIQSNGISKHTNKLRINCITPVTS